MKRSLFWLHAACAGAVAVVVILSLCLPLWWRFGLDFAPKLASDFIIEHTPPDNAIALQKTLGSLAMPSALLGGVMFTGMLGATAGIVYALLCGRSRGLAVVLAGAAVPTAVWFCFPNMTLAALAPLTFSGLLVSWITRHNPTLSDAAHGITRRQALRRMVAFVGGGLAVSVAGGLPVFLTELRTGTVGRVLFGYKPPAPRQAGFAIDGLAPEVTPLSDFYTMRKFATPIPTIPENWRLTMNGAVEQPLTLSFDDLLAMPRHDAHLTRQCISNPVGGYLMSTALISGVTMAAIMQRAKIKPAAVQLVFYGRDGYSESLPVEYALTHGLLSYAMNGVLLPAAHGAPLRVEMPGLYGFKSLKWLDRIEAVETPYVAVWEQQGWARLPTLKTTSRIDTAYFDTAANRVIVAGVAFAGVRGIRAVEVQINGGAWQPAALHLPPLSKETWVQWRTETTLRGMLTIAVRAVDGDGNPQIPIEQKQFPDGASGYHVLKITA